MRVSPFPEVLHEARQSLEWSLVRANGLERELIACDEFGINQVSYKRKQFFRQGENATLRLVATKSFSKGIVKLTYEPQE